MHQLRKHATFVMLIVLASTLSAQSRDLTLMGYIERAVEVSGQIESAERALEAANERQAETSLSGATPLDIEEAESAVAAAELALVEARNGVIYQAFGSFVAHTRRVRSLEFATRQLEITRENERLAKERFEEGVNTEQAYLGSVSSRLNGELSHLESTNGLEASRRGLLRDIKADIDQPAEPVSYRIPYLSVSYDEQTLLGEIRDASSAYLKARAAADIARRRYQALQRLSTSVTEKELEDASRSAESTAMAYEAAVASTEDHTWQLIATLAVQEKSVETGEQLLAVAEKSWEKRVEQHDFGLISDLQLDSYELSNDQSRDQAVRRIGDHFMHVLSIEQARGADLLEFLNRRLR